MLIHDDSGKVIVDNNGDAGDSANRNGLWVAMSRDPMTEINLSWYFVLPGGLCVRHPKQVPWNNFKNFSRDQLIPLISGLYFQRNYRVVESIFWSHAKRFFFCQNSERDYVGTKKYPWPHSFINDRNEPETRGFDFADPLLPNDIWLLIRCAHLWYLYPLYPIGLLFFLLSLVLHCRFNTDSDEGQIICACKVHGKWAIKLYTILRPDFAQRLFEYWVKDRDQVEIFDRVMKGMFP